MNIQMNRNESRGVRMKDQRSSLREGWNSLFKVLAILPLVAIIIAVIWGGKYLFVNFNVPINTVSVTGAFSNIKKQEIEELIKPLVVGEILSLDLAPITSLLESHPWIERATVRRKWPGGLEIKVIEENPIARWGEKSFLNDRGEILQIENNNSLSDLPLLQGNKHSEKLLIKTYRETTLLLQSENLQISELKQDDAGVWRLMLSNGLELVIGRDQIIAKIRRFLVIWKATLSSRSGDVASVDVRYDNGVAVRWR